MRFQAFLAAGLVAICTSATSRAQWNADAWPSCDHSGKTFMPDGKMYRQVWAGDMFNALNERASVLYTNGWAGLTGGVSTNWWRSYTGVTNRVVRNEREVLEFFRLKTAAMLDQYADPTVTNIIEHVNSQYFERTFVDSPRVFYGDCDGGLVQIVSNQYTYTLVYSKSETNTAINSAGETILNKKLNTSDHDHGSNYCAVAQVPYFFFEQDAIAYEIPSYLTPNRLRGGLCLSATNMPSYEVSVPSVSEVDPIAELVAVSSSNSADIDVEVVNGSDKLPYIVSSNLFYELEIMDDEGFDQVATNVFNNLGYTSYISISVSNSSAFVASNVIVGVSVSENIELEIVTGNFPGLNWSNWKRKPVTFKANTMAAGQVVNFEFWARFNRDPGESPRSNQKWYYPDYGWDGLRRVVNTMDRTMFAVSWYWPESTNNQHSGSSHEELQPTNTWASAKSAAIANDIAGIDRTGTPTTYSRGLYGFEGECLYAAQYLYRASKASVTNIEAYVYAPSFNAEVYAYERYEGVYSSRQEELGIVLVGTGSGSSSFFTDQIGGTSIVWITDPGETPGFDESGYQNTNYITREWISPFCVMTWEFLYND